MAEPQIKDQRGWAPVDTGYLDNPKMLDVLDASGTAALMHLASVLYCAQHLTDGHIAPGVARRKVGASKDDDRLLIDAGLWHEQGHACPDCPQPEPNRVYVHDFLQHNRTAAKAKKASEGASRAAKERWAREKAEKADADRMRNAMPDAMRLDDPRNAEREKERKRDTSPSGTADAAPRPDIESLCQRLSGHIVNNGGKQPNITKRWRDEARLLLDRDGRDLAEAERVLDWSQASTFWKANIMSMPKFREKYDQLRLQAEADTAQQQGQVFDPRNGW